MARVGRDTKTLKTLEAQAGGRDGLARLLLFAPPGAEKLLDLLDADDRRPLVVLLREAGLSPAWLAKTLADAKVEFEREVARASAVDAAPEIIEDLKAHAIDRMRRCPRLCSRIDGMGPKTMVRLGTDTQVCPECEGRGETMQSSGHKSWAADRLLKIAALPEENKTPLVAVQNNNFGTKGGGLLPDFMEKIAKASHAVVGRTEIVEAEVVKSEEPSTPSES